MFSRCDSHVTVRPCVRSSSRMRCPMWIRSGMMSAVLGGYCLSAHGLLPGHKKVDISYPHSEVLRKPMLKDKSVHD